MLSWASQYIINYCILQPTRRDKNVCFYNRFEELRQLLSKPPKGIENGIYRGPWRGRNWQLVKWREISFKVSKQSSRMRPKKRTSSRTTITMHVSSTETEGLSTTTGHNLVFRQAFLPVPRENLSNARTYVRALHIFDKYICMQLSLHVHINTKCFFIYIYIYMYL